jgi:uncharacterized repeat protein (TIGR02543 family)
MKIHFRSSLICVFGVLSLHCGLHTNNALALESAVADAIPRDILAYYPYLEFSNVYRTWSQLSHYTRKDIVPFTDSAGKTHYYEVVEIPNGDLEWLAAAYLAQQSGGYLVSPETEDENAFVFDLINRPEYWFTWDHTHNYVTSGPPIGGFQINSIAPEADSAAGWMWLSGEPMDYTNWCQNLDDDLLDTDPRDNTQPNDATGYNQDAMFYGEITSPVATWGDFPVRFGDIQGGEGATYYAFVIEYNAMPVALSVYVVGEGIVIGTNIACPDICAEHFANGATVTLTATPDAGSVFNGWDGACSGTATVCTVTMDTDQSVTAIFTAVPVDMYALSISVSGSGSVTGSEIVCPGDCQENYAAGTQVTLTAIPDVDAHFTGWGGACTGNNLTCEVLMDQARSILARFSDTSPTDVPLAISVLGAGLVTSDPDGLECERLCVEHFAPGTGLTLTATPAEGWTFAGWEGTCDGELPSCALTLNEAQTATALFVEDAVIGEEPLDVVIVGRGTVTSSPAGIDCGDDCEESCQNGATMTLTATPEAGSDFTGWGGACIERGTNPICTLSMDEARLAVAVFAGAIVRPETTAWKVAEIYMATMGYAPDSEGLQYWITNIDTLPQWTPETVAQSFFDQPLVQEVYPPTQGFGSFIDALYRNIFGRGADQEGYAYWLQQLENGQIARQHMIIAMINGGWDNPSPDALSDMQRFGYRIEVALAFAQYQADNGINYSEMSEANQQYLREVGRDILLGVTTDEGTRDAAIDSIPILLEPLAN